MHSLLELLDGVMSILCRRLEFLGWREEWDRTSNPVAYWFAVGSAAGLVIMVLVATAPAWAAVASWMRRPW